LGLVSKIAKAGYIILELLVMTRSHQSTDLQDKVFAFLGIAVDIEDQDEPHLRPNYDIPTEEVYRNLAVFHLKQRTALGILTVTRHTQSGSDLPSWVSNWNVDAQMPIQSRHLSWVCSSDFALNIEKYKPDFLTPPSEDSAELALKSKQFDKITAAGLPLVDLQYSYDSHS
jgi:hypothetical protein